MYSKKDGMPAKLFFSVSSTNGRGRLPNSIVSMQVAVCLLLSVLCSGPALALNLDQEPVGGASAIDFDRQIRPVLSNACFHCHGPDAANREADLRLDDEAAAKEYVIVAGDSNGSELLRRIESADPNEVMPPPDQKQQLTDEQVALLKKWIDQGAPWTKHWSYEKPKRWKYPQVDLTGWPQTGIDHFVLAKLEEQGLKPSSRASREKLFRRVSLDLTGLPPTIEQLDTFLADESATAYERAVDRLLASPRYGEHMALPWLAAARYADTNGYQQDRTRTMWPWRDWVVRSMNENLSFDKFTIYQLAGDLLPDPTRDQLIATGFHRNHALNGEGGRNQEESRVEYVIDRTDATGAVWMGLTLGCARCHDHKYDTVSQKEFYQMSAYFNQVDESGGVDAGGNAKPTLPLPTHEQAAAAEKLQDKIAALEKQIKTPPEPTDKQLLKWVRQTEAWLEKEQVGTLWHSPANVDLSCKGKVDWKQLDDQSVLVSKMENSADAYTVTLTLPVGTHHALRIEAFKHPTLNHGLFSTGIKGGFSVTDLEVELHGEGIKLKDARTNIGGQKAADGLLDKNKYTTWTVNDPSKSPEVPTWLAKFESPIEVEESNKLVVRMKHESRTGDAPIGRFRISLTAYPQPNLKPQLGFSDELAEALSTPSEQLSPSQTAAITQQWAVDQQIPLRKRIEEIKSELAQQQSKYLHTMIMRDRKQPRKTYRLERGLWNNPDKSEPLHPATLACLPPLPEDAPKSRLALARWLVSSDHPLTARVTVNRYWQQFFGVGLVKTSEDFGVQGERPSHPKLLDWLATEFVESGWDVKHIHKLIVMSASYQQSSKSSAELLLKDPANRLLARGPRFRLTAQTLRDQALALSGLLVEKQGGPGVMPYQPPGVWSDFSLGKIKYKQGKGEALYRRSIYTFWRRSVGPTLFFDNAARQMCTVRPSLTNTPLHALTLLNDTTYVEAARNLAERLIQSDYASDKERIQAAFRMATSRFASEEELDSLLRALNGFKADFQADADGASALVSVGESPLDPSVDVVELAAYTSLMNVVLNLDEVVTKG